MIERRVSQLLPPRTEPLTAELRAKVRHLYLNHSMSCGVIASELGIKQSQVIDALKMEAVDAD